MATATRGPPPQTAAGWLPPCKVFNERPAFTEAGLRTLEHVLKQRESDLRRTGASIALNRSMSAWLEKKSRAGNRQTDDGTSSCEPAKRALSRRPSQLHMSQGLRKARVTVTRLNLAEIHNLETAFRAHASAFDLDGDGSISVEELLAIFKRCDLLDNYFTPEKVRYYFDTWAEGCNCTKGVHGPLEDGAIRFPEFQQVLGWAADMLRIDFQTAAQRVVAQSRKLCDKEASIQQRLEVAFDGFSKRGKRNVDSQSSSPSSTTAPASDITTDTDTGVETAGTDDFTIPPMVPHMTAFEFCTLCRAVELDVSVGDVILVFQEVPEACREGVDYKGFIRVIKKLGEKLGRRKDIFSVFAKSVDALNTDELELSKLNVRLRQSATVIGDTCAQRLLDSCHADENGGNMDFDTFLSMCQTKLHLVDCDHQLRLLFKRLDKEGNSTISIYDFLEIITSA